MSDEISMPTDIVSFAEELISGEPRSLEIIKIDMIDNEEETHDDEFQKQKHLEFEAVHRSLVEKLSQKFGTPKIAMAEDEFNTIPLCGVSPAATWEVNGAELFLAVSHEEREAPYLLAIGVA